MAKKYFVENGYIPIPENNSHLSAKTREIIKQGQRARTAKGTQGRVQTGDIVVDAHGQERRVCLANGDNCQTTTAMEHSYYTGALGGGDFSGSLGQSVNYSELTKEDQTRPALFWTFRDGRSGGGRGVDLWMDVTVWSFSGSLGNGLWGADT